MGCNFKEKIMKSLIKLLGPCGCNLLAAATQLLALDQVQVLKVRRHSHTFMKRILIT